MAQFPLDDDLPRWWLAGRRRRAIEFLIIYFVLAVSFGFATQFSDLPLVPFLLSGIAVWIVYRLIVYAANRLLTRGSVDSPR